MIKVSDPYKPLYTTKKPIIIITGGRGSAKSFNVSLFIKRLTYALLQVILYARYTMTSAKTSIIPEFQEKIDLEGDNKYFYVANNEIVNKRSGSKIIFSGIKTSSGNQTANLKGITGLSTFVLDEGEEWLSEQDFDTISLSIRKKGVQNRTIVIMNPPSTQHFIYKKYIEKTHRIKVIDGVEVQISTHPDVEHIHTTYLDNIEHLSEKFLKEVRDMKLTDFNKYSNKVIGRWIDGNTVDGLYHGDSITNILSNYVQPASKINIVCDAAKYGRDLCVTMVFRGWEVLYTSVLKKSDMYDIVEDIEDLRKTFKVSKSDVLVDGDGVGSNVVKKGGYKSFHGGAKPIKTSKVVPNYKNLNHQCAFYLADEVINKGELLINCNDDSCRVDGVRTSKIKIGHNVTDVKDLIKEDLRCIKYTLASADGKKSTNTKDEQKEIIGRSPDFFDVLKMNASLKFKKSKSSRYL